MATRLGLARAQVLAHRRRVAGLDRRVAGTPATLRRAAWAGLQDSMPRAALLSLNARIEGTRPTALDEPHWIQLWGPRYSVYVVAARDRAVFSLGRLPDRAAARSRAWDLAARLAAFAGDDSVSLAAVAQALGGHHSRLRYAAPTGTVLVRWDGARAPTVRSVPAPDVDPWDARLELARRHLHVFGPTSAEAFAGWAGLRRAEGEAAFDALRTSLLPVRTPIGDRWILAEDEDSVRAAPGPAAPARLLPSGDTYFLLQGDDRELLVPEVAEREQLWTSRVWPGALVVGGDVVGTWRRAGAKVTIRAWRRLTDAEVAAVTAEAESLPLPGVDARVTVRWDD